MSDTPYINSSAVRKLCHQLGRRAGKDFLTQLNALVARKTAAACGVHNGGKKTLDASVAGFVGIR